MRATPKSIQQQLSANALIDVRSVLPDMRTPVLVIQQRHYQIMTAGNGRYLADHANSWAVYGQVAGHTDMTDWEIEEGADKPHPMRTFRLLPGDAGWFDVGALHSIDYSDGARFARVTGADIDDAPVQLYNDVDVRTEVATHLGGLRSD
ncbi:MAG: hypothetical protein HOI95_01580 [Chromatiales bacterium]|nr:hypothetical protein [Chromatiales bacterium]